ncbi:MAG: rhodanese-like domain-containing protein [Terracidiphilus sp.]
MMKKNHLAHLGRMALVLLSLVILLGARRASAQFAGPAASPASALSIPAAQLVQPAELAKMLALPAAERPLVFQVGSRVFFAQAHIPGSVYAGPGSQPAGLELLASKVAKVKKDQLIVLYCGCCPWNRCPNVAPALQKLLGLGFTNVKVLYLASNFGDDWVAKNLPVERDE